MCGSLNRHKQDLTHKQDSVLPSRHHTIVPLKATCEPFKSAFDSLMVSRNDTDCQILAERASTALMHYYLLLPLYLSY
jgi:hypothetical protein